MARLLTAGHDVALVLAQPDRPSGRGLKALAGPVKALALANGLAVFQPVNFRAPDTIERVKSVRPEALVVAAYGLILPQQLLDVPRYGAINIHASLLPRWRGAAPIQRALLAGDSQTGVSIMQMDAGLDTGPVLAQQALPIEPQDDAGSLHDKLATLGAEMIVTVLEAVAAGRARPVPQPRIGVTYARKIDKKERILDWARPAAEIERAVRAFHPAATLLEGENLKVWRARTAQGAGDPGTVLDREGIVVACGEGAVEIVKLQRAGGKRLDSREFLRGRRLPPGTRFG